MKINKIELTNVKCYSEAKFEFENGINFISGKNGAGKTTIIESIGFALFDYKLSKNFTSYFIRHGEKRASVRIWFKDKNSKDYIVERKLGYQSAYNSWIIKDIDEELEIVSGETDVTAWLKEHLGFYENDNISQIYENVIGVPQGMFTSIFLDTEKNRRLKLDPIFNLEIYRKVYANSAKLESGMKEKNNILTQELTNKQGMITILKDSTKEYKTAIAENKKQKKEKEKIEKSQNAIIVLNKIRGLIKDAPESISKVLIQSVGKRASSIYHQIATDNTKLAWKENYEVVLLDNIDGNFVEKDFRQLSGGEQMSAALAIRIAMLEVLTNMKIGILDEPTVNMDSQRREHLADMIEKVGQMFVQLFVVSHDDTFNSITDYIIEL